MFFSNVIGDIIILNRFLFFDLYIRMKLEEEEWEFVSEDKQERREFDLTKVLTVSAGHLTHDIFTAFLPPVLPLLIEKSSLSYCLLV